MFDTDWKTRVSSAAADNVMCLGRPPASVHRYHKVAIGGSGKLFWEVRIG